MEQKTYSRFKAITDDTTHPCIRPSCSRRAHSATDWFLRRASLTGWESNVFHQVAQLAGGAGGEKGGEEGAILNNFSVVWFYIYLYYPVFQTYLFYLCNRFIFFYFTYKVEMILWWCSTRDFKFIVILETKVNLACERITEKDLQTFEIWTSYQVSSWLP